MNVECETVYRLNRIFNIFNEKVYMYLILTNIFILIAGISFNSFDKSSIAEFISIFVIINAITIISLVFHCPDSFTVIGKSLEFDDYISLRPEFRYGKGFWWLKVSYSVTEIKNVEFHQNVIEKIFDVGHISFSGKATFSAKRDLERIPDKNDFVIYGIKHFSQFKTSFLNG